MEPVGRKEQGNRHGAVGGRSRREEQEVTPGTEELEQLRRGEQKRMDSERRFQSSGSGEEEGRGKAKGRKENAPNKSLSDFPDARMFPVGRKKAGEDWGPQEQGCQGGGGRLRAPGGSMKTTAPPFRSSLPLMQPVVPMPASRQQ